MWRLANSSWVGGNSAGSMNGDGSRKLLLHSTEGATINGAIGAYRTNNSWPHFTVDCKRRQVTQHLDVAVAARSLRNDPGGADQTNRDGSVHVQIEMVGFAGTPASIGSTDDLAWFGRQVVAPICAETGIPIQSTVTWRRYPDSYGKLASQRLSPSAWDAYSGVLGHQHAPDNSHGDPGLIDIHEILNAAQEGDDMALSTEDKNWLRELMADRRREIVEYVDQRVDELTKLLAPWGSEAFDRAGQPGTPGEPGVIQGLPQDRWLIEVTRKVRELHAALSSEPDQPIDGA